MFVLKFWRVLGENCDSPIKVTSERAGKIRSKKLEMREIQNLGSGSHFYLRGSLHALFTFGVDEISGALLSGEAGGGDFAFRVRRSFFLRPTSCSNPALSRLLINGRLACSPVRRGAVFGSLLSKATLPLQLSMTYLN